MSSLRFAPSYVEYGKVFSQNGASGYVILDHSDVSITRYLKSSASRSLLSALQFSESSAFATKSPPAVSAALLRSVDFSDSLIFVQIQRRREGEFGAPGVSLHSNRPYNQLRFTLISLKDFKNAFQNQEYFYALYHALLFNDPKSNRYQMPFLLKDYVTQGEQKKVEIAVPVITLPPKGSKDDTATKTIVNAIANSVVVSTNTRDVSSQPVAILADVVEYQSINRKIELIQNAQIWLQPLLGPITFALGYITNQNVDLCLFDALPEMQYPISKNRVHKLSTPPEFANDYYMAVSSLSIKQLNNSALSLFIKKYLSSTRVALDCFLIVDQQIKDLLELVSKVRDVWSSIDNNDRKLIADKLFDSMQKVALNNLDNDQTQVCEILLDLAQRAANIPKITESVAIVLHKGKTSPTFFNNFEGILEKERDLIYSERTDGYTNKLYKIIEVLETEPSIWLPKDYLSFLEHIPEPTTSSVGQERYAKLFNNLLNPLTHPSNHAKLAEDPDSFQKFLIKGRRIFAKWDKLKSSKDTMEEPIINNIKSPQRKTNLWEACITISQRDLSFAKWWFLNEIAGNSTSLQIASTLETLASKNVNILQLIGDLSSDAYKTNRELFVGVLETLSKSGQKAPDSIITTLFQERKDPAISKYHRQIAQQQLKYLNGFDRSPLAHIVDYIIDNIKDFDPDIFVGAISLRLSELP